MMREFHKPDPVLIKLLGPQRRKDGSDYLRSPFTLLTELDGKRYCFSTLTKQGLELPPGFDPAGRCSPAELDADPALSELLRGWFLKPAERDETKFYESVAAMMRAFQTRKGLSSYVILPTLGCNARCSYCYEAGVKPVSMCPETVDRTLAYVLRSRRPGTRLYLQWFGGEPLLGVDAIERILAGLRAEGVDYRCGFTTNGSLIDEALADRMAGPWNTASVQITIDGTEETYARIKNYVNCPDAYRRVLRAVSLLADREIAVSVRVNLDGTNSGELGGILRDLAAAVRAKDKVWVYLAPLYQIRAGEGCLEAWKEADRLSAKILEAGFRTQQLVGLDTRFRTFRCMADSPSSNILITPEGQLSFCQHRIADTSFGNVTDGITEPAAVKALAALPPVSEKCRDCPFLPDCTPFRDCPVYDRDCLEVRRFKSESQLHEMIRRAEARAAEAGQSGEETDPDREALETLLFHAE